MKAVSSRLEGAIGKLPSEFVRQPRGLNEFARYKATEFRTFLLYTGLFALKDIVKQNVYEHFFMFKHSCTYFTSSQEHEI